MAQNIKYPNPAEIILAFLNGLILVVILVIGLRFLLELFGANSAAPFVNWINETSLPLLGPFRGIFPATRLEGGFIIDFTALFAIFAYSFLWYIIQYILDSVEYNRNQRRLS